MAKAITKATVTLRESTFSMDKDVLRMACDDGTTYVAERPHGGRQWTMVARYDRDGVRHTSSGRLPACVEAHMDGRTGSGPYGRDGDTFWSK